MDSVEALGKIVGDCDSEDVSELGRECGVVSEQGSLPCCVFGGVEHEFGERKAIDPIIVLLRNKGGYTFRRSDWCAP